MKYQILLILILPLACTSRVSDTEHIDQSDTTIVATPVDSTGKISTDTISAKVYGNQRFRNVRVTRQSDSTFLVTGQGQIFEANFGWVIEDGHNELSTGHQMTDAGAPEWGDFSFTVNAVKTNPNTTLHLVLFETSAKDGSRQHELPVLLY